MRIFDLGLLPHQLAELEKHVEAVIKPDWDLGRSESYPPWFRAMTSRPFLPKYASDAEIICLDQLRRMGAIVGSGQ